MISVIGRRLGSLLAATLLCAVAGQAQGASPFEVSLGYSYLRANATPHIGNSFGMIGMNGGAGEFAASVGHGLSAVASVGGNFQNNVGGSGRSLTIETFLFGPRYSSHQSKKWTPFVQFLAGAAHDSGTLYAGTVTSLSPITYPGSANGFSLSAGGGLDWNARRNVSVRLFQAEYLMTRLSNADNKTQNDIRLTFGVVFHFGKARGH